MDWDRYKQLCDTPSVFTRWMLEQTSELMTQDGSKEGLLHRVLRQTALAKPEDHKGGPATDVFELDLALDEVVDIVRVVVAAHTAGTTTSATRQRGLGGFVEAWQEYENYLRVEQGRDGTAGN